MNYIRRLSIILCISFAGELLNRVIPLPVPAGVYGLVILFLCLLTRLIPLSAVREAGRFLIEIMPVLFIPASVGLMNKWDMLQPVLLPAVVMIVVSSVAVMAVSGHTTQAVIRREKRRERHD